MIDLVGISCTGCAACVNMCPVNAIKMIINDYGDLVPKINSEHCIHCEKCSSVCPQIVDTVTHRIKEVYVGWNEEYEERKNSSSGGIATLLFKEFIKSGGYVAGTMWNEENNAHIYITNSLDELWCFQGSKYVQADTQLSFRKIRELLRNGEKILFIGTPCQVSGLKNYLANKYNKISYVDLLCHGVSSQKYLSEYINWICKRKKITNVTNISFRSNIYSNNFCFCLWNGNSIIYKKMAQESYYFRAFLHGISLRESCYTCKYKSLERTGDLTIGDFIGYGINVKGKRDDDHASLIAVNNDQGKRLLEEFSIYKEKKSIDEALVDGRSLREPFPRHSKQKKFRELYASGGFIYAIRKILLRDIILEYLHKVYRKIMRTIRKSK